jgi:hypothetical protein
MEPTIEQLQVFYRVVRQYVLLSVYIVFVELGEDANLYIFIGYCDRQLDRANLDCITSMK